jgi:hypothetical protein
MNLALSVAAHPTRGGLLMSSGEDVSDWSDWVSVGSWRAGVLASVAIIVAGTLYAMVMNRRHPVELADWIRQPWDGQIAYYLQDPPRSMNNTWVNPTWGH